MHTTDAKFRCYMVRAFLVALAAMCFALGILGVVLPGLPATPFFLATAWLLSRSSPRLHDALLRSAVVGPILSDWRERRGLTRRTKTLASVVVVGGTVVTCLVSSLPPDALACVAVLTVIGVTTICYLPSAAKRPAAGRLSLDEAISA